MLLFHFLCYLKIDVPSGYENDEPLRVVCETDIFHPNIDTSEEEFETCGHNVCLNLLDKGTWNHKFGFEGAVTGLLYLLHNPNWQSPVTPDFVGVKSEDDYKEKVALYMRGEEVAGRSFKAEFLNELKEKTSSDSSDKTILTTESSESDAQREGQTESVDINSMKVQSEDETAINQNASDSKVTKPTPKELNGVDACANSGNREDIAIRIRTWDGKDLFNSLSEFELKFGVDENNREEVERCKLVTVGDDVMFMSNTTDEDINKLGG